MLAIVVAICSETCKKTPAQQLAARSEPLQPSVQDNSNINVQDLKNQFAAVRQKEVQQAGLTNATAVQQADVAANTRGAGCDATIFPNNKVGLGPQIGDEIQKAQRVNWLRISPLARIRIWGNGSNEFNFNKEWCYFILPTLVFRCMFAYSGNLVWSAKISTSADLWRKSRIEE